MRLILALLFVCSATVAAQAPDPISLAELLDAYKGTVLEARGGTQARFEAMLATPQGQAYEKALKHQQDVEARLAKRIQDRTGKAIDWQNGALRDPAEPSTK
jgi:hypothetical protein